MMATQQAQFPGALWMPHRNYWHGRSGHQIRYIIIHGTATPGLGTAQAVGRLFQKRHDGKHGGTHYIVGKDGAIVQGVLEENAAWGNGITSTGHDPWWGTRGNPNLETISIEFVKTTSDNREALTPAQIESGFRLISYLVRKWEIPARWADAIGGITGHYSIDPVGRRFCPGLFPWDELLHQLQAPAEYPGLPTAYNPTAARPASPSSSSSSISSSSSSSISSSSSTSPSPESGNATPIRSAGARAHELLAEAPGFAGIVASLDAAEAFAPLAISSPLDVFGWLGGNAFALLVRLVLILAGLAIVFGLIVALARKNEWLGEARGDALPIMLGGA
jgi:N-acetyl-anhydromuramyl-L-alanine amidase AmpD